MSTYMKEIFRVTDDFDTFSFGDTYRFRCISKQESSMQVKTGVSNALTVASLAVNADLIIAQAAAESTITIEFTAVQPDDAEPGDPPVEDAADIVMPFVGIFSFRPLHTTQRVSKITISSALTTLQDSYIGLFYAGA